MINWKKALITPNATLRDAIEAIDASSIKGAVVVDDVNRVCGTVTDGDVRRSILRGISLDTPIVNVMKKDPLTASENDSKKTILNLMKSKRIHQIPVLDAEGILLRVDVLDDLLQETQKDNIVVLMAGGYGTRLKPLTDDCPKPLLPVGNKPILEIILEHFVEQGFRKFYISVYYMDEMVRAHFGDGSKWGVDISYLHEDERRGTAGALALLPEKPTAPFFVMNGDLLTKVNFQHLLDFHGDHKAKATMCVREYDFQVPFGVVQMDEHRIVGIEEKPVQSFFVNAGIYLFEPEVLDYIDGEYLDMPTLFDQMKAAAVPSVAFPIREYWLDIGHVEDLARANGEFAESFKIPKPPVGVGNVTKS